MLQWVVQYKQKLNDAETRTTFLVVGKEEDIFKKVILDTQIWP